MVVGSRVRFRYIVPALSYPTADWFKRIVEPGETGTVIEGAQPDGWVLVRVDGDPPVYAPAMPGSIEEVQE